MPPATRPLSRLVLFAFLGLLACATLLPGCGGGSGGGGYGPVYAGTLEIENSPASFETIIDIEVADRFGPYYTYYANQFVGPGEGWFLDLYPSTYDVTLYWSDFLVETYTVDIFEATTTTIFASN